MLTIKDKKFKDNLEFASAKVAMWPKWKRESMGSSDIGKSPIERISEECENTILEYGQYDRRVENKVSDYALIMDNIRSVCSCFPNYRGKFKGLLLSGYRIMHMYNKNYSNEIKSMI